MNQKSKSYKKILLVATHISFVCYTLGYVAGMLEYNDLGYFSFVVEDIFIISTFVITYILFISKKVSYQTAMKILAILIVGDMLYPGIIMSSHAPVVDFYEDTIAMHLILVIVVAFTTSRPFAIFITVAVTSLIVINAFLLNTQLLIDNLPVIILCIAVMGTFSIICEDFIRKLLDQEIESRKKIEELSDYKQNVIRHVIHDLKVPVNSILNLSSGETHSNLDSIHSNALDINKQLEKILDIERLEEPNLVLNKEFVAVETLINSAILSLITLINEKNIIIKTDYKMHGQLLCDVDLIERLIVNILVNAVKYSPLNSKISIRVSSNKSNCEIVVKDRGKGIAKEHLQYIFDKFYIVSNQKTNSSFSTGLGLAFCKLVTDVHNGKIFVSSEVGKGTEFKIVLPDFRLESDVDKSINTEVRSAYLTEAERRYLSNICAQISDIPIHRVSEIMSIIHHLSTDKNKNVVYWYDRLTDAIYTGNTTLFNELTDVYNCN
ncbi:MAG: HAMP domain-containing sensor histidine kinase [Bacteroidales bacterium]|nr:HAMP domain-containing sensor histidine kinase [Bacteroidales bacterium]